MVHGQVWVESYSAQALSLGGGPACSFLRRIPGLAGAMGTDGMRANTRHQAFHGKVREASTVGIRRERVQRIVPLLYEHCLDQASVRACAKIGECRAFQCSC